MKKQNCIIYGGAGFIGSHIADNLLERNYSVTIFDKTNISLHNIEHILGKIDYIEGDFTNEKDIAKSIKGNDYAIHLVSTTLPAVSNLNPYYDVETNLKSSLHLFEECVKNKIKKVIFISSGGTVYGNADKFPIKEYHSTNPITSYGIVKLTIEKYLGLFKQLKGLDYTILRFSNPFGERQNPRLGQGIITSLLYKIKHKLPIEIWGDGKIVRDYFYIIDGVKAIHKAIIDSSKNNVYNISSGKGVSINQLLDKFRKVLNIDFKVKYTPARNFDISKNILDNRLALKYLGWKPETGFNTALKNTWRYIVDNEQ
jgi:UDP-glucose 4-epimerase